MVCPNCGYNNQATNRFCVRCGIDVAAPAPTLDPVAAPPPAAAPAPPNPWGAPPNGPYAAPGQPPPPPAPAYASAPPAPPNPFAPPPAAYGPPGYPPGAYGQYPVPYPPGGYPPSTNGLAIASLVLGLVGWLPCAIGSVLAIVLGFVARSQIRAAQGRQGGDGLALAGIILGFLGVALVILFFAIGTIAGSHSGQS